MFWEIYLIFIAIRYSITTIYKELFINGSEIDDEIPSEHEEKQREKLGDLRY